MEKIKINEEMSLNIFAGNGLVWYKKSRLESKRSLTLFLENEIENGFLKFIYRCRLFYFPTEE